MATYTWNALFGTYTSPLAWLPFGVPTANDLVLLPASQSGTLSGTGTADRVDMASGPGPWTMLGTLTTNWAFLNAPTTVVGTLRLRGKAQSGALPSTGQATAAILLDRGTLDSSGGTFTLAASTAALNLRTAPATFLGLTVAAGTLDLQGGSVLTVIRNTALEQSGQVSGTLVIGRGGAATATIAGGSLFTVDDRLSLGEDAGSRGQLTVSDASSVLTPRTNFLVGNAGSGTLGVTNGGKVSSGPLYGLGTSVVGAQAGSIGLATIAGTGSLWTSWNKLVIGQAGQGQVRVTGGGSLVAQDTLTVASASGSVGALVSRRCRFDHHRAAGAALGSGGAATLSATNAGLVRTPTIGLARNGTVSVDTTGRVVVGTGAGEAGAITIEAASTLTAQGGRLTGPISLQGTLTNAGATLTIEGSVYGLGTLSLGAGLVEQRGSFGSPTIRFTAPGATLRTKGLFGVGTVTGFQPGDTIAFAEVSNAALLTTDGQTTLYQSTGSLALGAAPAGMAYRLYGDGQGGQQLLLDAPPSPGGIAWSNVTAGTNGAHTATAYAGPVDYLQQQYVWSNDDAAAVKAGGPNVFLKGGAAGDALQVTGGSNVIDGGGGSNYLIGADGSDGGFDTFFVDSRGGVETWSTILDFHQGDRATIFGFHPGVSTRPYTDSDGAVGAKGLTIHSEINGAGTGILGSITFAGIDRATADAHFSITEDTLLKGTPSAIDYLLVQWNR